MILAVLSLFFTEPAPLDMPRAEAYLVRENGAMRLEDRYDRNELWASQAVVGRWMDADGRIFTLANLDWKAPSVELDETVTRAVYAAKRAPMKRVRATGGFPSAFRQAVAELSPCPVVDRPRPSRQLPHGFRDVCYWQDPTNYTTVVCTFRREGDESWHLATWALAEGDDYVLKMDAFDRQFLRREFGEFLSARFPGQPEPHVRCRPERGGAASSVQPSERELLRADARHAVAAYPNWHFTGAEEFAILDDLPERGFVSTLTNDLAVMRAKYAAALPTFLDGSNVLSVVRLYADREEYLGALALDGATNLFWTAAYWCPSRRELVAHLSAGGERELMRTVRHEAFHQYLSYATAMTPVSPWLNEGYAQYFEDEASGSWGEGLDVTDEFVDRMAANLPALLAMDYEAFYEGDDFDRLCKYRAAWSVVRFIEKGADKVRLKPFAGLKERYMRELVETHDMRRATAVAFRNADTLGLFVDEWKKFWKKR